MDSTTLTLQATPAAVVETQGWYSLTNTGESTALISTGTQPAADESAGRIEPGGQLDALVWSDGAPAALWAWADGPIGQIEVTSVD